jgi:hypothetical protein
VADREVDVALGAGVLRIRCGDPIGIVPGWVAPSYGVRRPAQVLRVAHEGTVPFELTTAIDWRAEGETFEGDRG